MHVTDVGTHTQSGAHVDSQCCLACAGGCRPQHSHCCRHSNMSETYCTFVHISRTSRARFPCLSNSSICTRVSMIKMRTTHPHQHPHTHPPPQGPANLIENPLILTSWINLQVDASATTGHIASIVQIIELHLCGDASATGVRIGSVVRTIAPPPQHQQNTMGGRPCGKESRI